MTFTPDLGQAARQPLTQRDLNTPTMSFTPDLEPAEVRAAVSRKSGPAVPPAEPDNGQRPGALGAFWQRNRVWVGLAVLAILVGLLVFTYLKREPTDASLAASAPPAQQRIMTPAQGQPGTELIPGRSQAAPRDRTPQAARPRPPSRRPVHADGTPWVGLGVDNQALEIEGDDLDGKPFKLSDYRGKVVMVDFWGNWCPYCQQMYPYDKKLVERMAGKPFVLLGVNSDRSKNVAKEALQKQQLKLRTWWDGGDTGKPISRQWNISGWPTYYIIDHKGIIRESVDGVPSDLLAVDRFIDKLVEEASSQKPKVATASAALHEGLKEGSGGSHPR
jgi:thiol-disulfide isomerase/thioredoxin